MRRFMPLVCCVVSALLTLFCGLVASVGWYGLMTDTLPAHCALCVVLFTAGVPLWGFLVVITFQEHCREAAK